MKEISLRNHYPQLFGLYGNRFELGSRAHHRKGKDARKVCLVNWLNRANFKNIKTN